MHAHGLKSLRSLRWTYTQDVNYCEAYPWNISSQMEGRVNALPLERGLMSLSRDEWLFEDKVQDNVFVCESGILTYFSVAWCVLQRCNRTNNFR